MSSLIVEVCEISKVEHHPNADRLDIATVKGWNCIVSRDQYKVGDLCVFFPPDSVLPEKLINDYELEFLKKGGRVGTLKLRGYISQGLILPVECVPPVYRLPTIDVTKVLGVTKYEVPEPFVPAGNKTTSKRTQNPNFTKYTDIENIQNFPDVFQDGDWVVITEKIHGSNMRFGWLPIEINFHSQDWLSILRSLFKKYVLNQKYEFVYGSHNVQLQWDNSETFYGSNIYACVLENVDKDLLPKGCTFYGEVFGKGVQELEYGRDGLDVAIFDIKNLDGKYLDWEQVCGICASLDIGIVPELYVGEFNTQELKHYTEGNSIEYYKNIREGCVVKSLHEENHPRIGRKILKSINPEYLAKKNRTEFH